MNKPWLMHKQKSVVLHVFRKQYLEAQKAMFRGDES